MPSASIEFSRISPTPSSTPRRAHSTASRPAAVRPPWVVTSKPDGARSRAPGVHRQHEHLVAEPAGDLGDHLGPADGAGVDRHLVRAGPQQRVDVVDRADAAADGQRDEHGLGGPAHHLERGLPALGRGRDVEEGQLVGPLGVVDRAELDRIAGVAQVDEVDALHDPAAVHVQAGDDTDSDRHDEQPSVPHSRWDHAEYRQR